MSAVTYTQGYKYPRVGLGRDKNLVKYLSDYFGYISIERLLKFAQQGAENEIWISAIQRVLDKGFRFCYRGRLYRRLIFTPYGHVAAYCRYHGFERLEDAMIYARHNGYFHTARLIERAIGDGFFHLDGIIVD